MDEQMSEAPSHLLSALDLITSFAKGHITYEEYSEKLDVWWDNNKEVWQDNDLSCLFRLVCITN